MVYVPGHRQDPRDKLRSTNSLRTFLESNATIFLPDNTSCLVDVSTPRVCDIDKRTCQEKCLGIGVNATYSPCSIYNVTGDCNDGYCLDNNTEAICRCPSSHKGEFCQYLASHTPRPTAPPQDDYLVVILVPVVAMAVVALLATCCGLAMYRRRRRRRRRRIPFEDSASFTMPTSTFLPRYTRNWRQFSDFGSMSSMADVDIEAPSFRGFNYPIIYPHDADDDSTDVFSRHSSDASIVNPVWYFDALDPNHDFRIDRPVVQPTPLTPYL
ncbi:uncharacterized protein [Haliotis asinina]|uniref:uncharacterized protein n=1 Tax=Haliotis asinina TaxID=109174 RepID=UPI003531D3BE